MNEQLETYLSQVEKQLAPLTTEKRDAELREIELHLEMMVEDYIAIGDSPDEAVAAAIRQFDAAGKMGRELQQAQAPDRLRRWRPLLAGVACYASIVAVYGSFCGFMDTFRDVLPQNPILFSLLSYNIVLVFSGLVSGWVAEIVAPRKAIWSVAALYFFMLYASRGSSMQNLQNITLPFAAAGLAACLGLWLRQRQVQKSAQKKLMLAR